MKVKLLVSRAVIGDSQNVGDEIEVSDAEGARMVEQPSNGCSIRYQANSHKEI